MRFETRFYLTGGKTPDMGSRTYTEIMREQRIKGEEAEVSFYKGLISELFISFLFDYSLQLRKKIQEKSKEGTLKISSENGSAPKRRGRWDQTVEESFVPAKKPAQGSATPTWGDSDVSFVFL